MPENIKFDDYLIERLKDPEFKKLFDEESAKLDHEVELVNKEQESN